MKTRHIVAVAAAHLALGSTVALGAAAQNRSDLVPPPKRQATVDIATKLTQTPTPAPVPEELKNPFNPTDFNQPDPSAPQTGPKPATPGAPVQPAAPTGDREILEILAQRIPSTGTVTPPTGGTLLVVGQRNRLKVGDVFTVTYNNQDYDLELVAIDRTTFTLRYRNEEITRPIKSK